MAPVPKDKHVLIMIISYMYSHLVEAFLCQRAIAEAVTKTLVEKILFSA